MPTVIGGGCGSYWIQSKDLKEKVIRKNGGVRVHCVSSSSTASAVDGPYKTLRIHANTFVSEIKTGLRRLAFQVQLKDSNKGMRKIYGVRVRCLSSNSAVDDPYHTLRIQPGASESEVKKAFRQLALQYHPDVCRGSNCGVQFHLINEAYDILMSKLRKQVRRKLRAESKADKSKSDKSFIPWTPPLPGAYKVNFDASFQKGKTALAALARDDYGEVVWAKALFGLAANSLAAEAEAAKMTAIWATEEKWNSVVLEGDDALEIVKAVTDTSMQLPCYIKSLAQDIRLLIRPYPRWSMASIPSSANTAAREMASWALRMNFSGSLSKHDLPISVMKALRKDSCRLPLDSSMP